ncbi:MAG: hypothetical protein L3J57_02360 [Desulfuromusa sp.]|nr:hypothetical protein [Desulfuromusa sp.]
MNRLNRLKKRYFIVLLIGFVVMFGVDTFAMTVESSVNVQASATNVKARKNTVVYLLSWQDNKMVTTNGTFYLSTDITVINHSGLGKEDVALQKNPPPIVHVDKVGRQMKTITILSNTQ